MNNENIVIAKHQITSAQNDWWQSDLSDMVDVPPEQIIGCYEYNGGVYLVYWYDKSKYP